jgi:hypothetical protein
MKLAVADHRLAQRHQILLAAADLRLAAAAADGGEQKQPGRDEHAHRDGQVLYAQALARDRAARELTSVVSSEVDRVAQQTFGVDTFQITPSLSDATQQSARFVPGARLTIGKRLSERAYLTYSRSLSSTTRDQIILLEYDQSDRFSWILSRNEDGTYAVDFRVRRTF